jgi:hypothetical protein
MGKHGTGLACFKHQEKLSISSTSMHLLKSSSYVHRAHFFVVLHDLEVCSPCTGSTQILSLTCLTIGASTAMELIAQKKTHSTD